MKRKSSKQAYLHPLLAIAFVFMTTACSPDSQPDTDPNDASENKAPSPVLEAPAWATQTQGLESRVDLNEQPVELVLGDGPAPQAHLVNLRRVATIQAPKLKSVSLTPTDVFLAGNLAYVSYCRVGDDYGGAVQIIDIQQPAKPKVIAELIQSDSDFYAIAGSQNRLFLAGSSHHPDLSSGATVQGLHLKPDGRGLAESLGMLELPSFAGIDVAANDKQIFVLSGDKEGALARIDAETLEPLNYFAVNGRSVHLAQLASGETSVMVFKAGEMQVLTPDLSLKHTAALSGSSPSGTDDPVLDLRSGQAVLRSQLGEAIVFDLDALTIRDRVKTQSPKNVRRLKASASQTAHTQDQVRFVNEGRRGVSVTRMGPKRIENLGTLKASSSTGLVRQQGCTVFMIDNQSRLNVLTHKLCPAGASGSLQAVKSEAEADRG